MESGETLLKKLDGKLSGLRGRLTADAGMDKITWFRAGGPAQVLFQPADEEDLSAFLKAVPEEIPILVVGIGSNLWCAMAAFPALSCGSRPRVSAKSSRFPTRNCGQGRQRLTSVWLRRRWMQGLPDFISTMASPAA